MKSEALQELVKKIFSEENTKQEFISNPESIISRYKLNKQEKRAVLACYSRFGLINNNSQQLESTLDPISEWLAPSP
jgi:hypothetical protein